jgi:cobalt-zinc-cadmium efflux system outer membrane protein
LWAPAAAAGGTTEPVATPIAATAPTVPVTWPELVAAIDRHPRLAAGRARVGAARGEVTAAGAAPNPTLEANAGRGVSRNGGPARLEWGLALTLPLGWIAQRAARVDAAEAEVDVALAEVELLRRDLLLELGTLFWSLAYEQARVAMHEALANETAVLVQTIAKRVEKGEARPIEATRVGIELELVGSGLDAARTALAARRAQLAVWLGLPAGREVEAVADLHQLPVAPDREAALARATNGHPRLTAAQARARARGAELRAEKLSRVPAFAVAGFVAAELDRTAYGGGIVLDLPLWNWSAGRVAQAEARRLASDGEDAAAWLEVELAVIDAQAACVASVATATRFDRQVVPRSAAAAAALERTYELGEASLLEVVDARRTLLEARRTLLGALSQAQIDCSRLGALVGEDHQ